MYSQLALYRSEIAPLSPEYANAMWSLVDYSTISNETLANLAANQSPSTNSWFESWADLFGMQYNVGDFGGTDGNVLDGTSVSHIENVGVS